jgi:hypothetical protein
MDHQVKASARAINPKDALVEGAKILKAALSPYGFRFRFRGSGRGSGGNFASGAFVRGNRQLELHFRWSLGLVRYHADKASASHEFYMRELGVWDRCQYPGFSDDPNDAFRGLGHDLGFAQDFLTGSALILHQAAKREAAEEASHNAHQMTLYVGDRRRLDEMRRHFREKRYPQVIELAGDLKYPYRMTSAELKMVEIARKRVP